jgi:integrase-like protein
MSQLPSLTHVDSIAAPMTSQSPKLLDRLRAALQARQFVPGTVARFVEWNRRYILFHKLRHPQSMGRDEIDQFLGDLARRGYGAAVQAEARRALTFLYRELLQKGNRLAGRGPAESAHLRCQSAGGGVVAESQAARPGARRSARATLRVAYRRMLCRMDAPVYPLPRQTPSARDGQQRDRGVLNPPGRRGTRFG